MIKREILTRDYQIKDFANKDRFYKEALPYVIPIRFYDYDGEERVDVQFLERKEGEPNLHSTTVWTFETKQGRYLVALYKDKLTVVRAVNNLGVSVDYQINVDNHVKIANTIIDILRRS